MTPESPTSGLLSWEPGDDHEAVLEAFDSQIQAGPARFRSACDTKADVLAPIFSDALEPLRCAFTASVRRIAAASTSAEEAWPQSRLAGSVRRAQLLAMEAPADFRHLVALRTDLDISVILGPASRAFDAAYEPINHTVFAGLEAAYGLGCGLRAAIEAHTIPDTVPADW